MGIIGMNMIIKIILMLTVLMMAGCAVFPSTTTVSATSKSGNLDNPTVKVQQEFKWSR